MGLAPAVIIDQALACSGCPVVSAGASVARGSSAGEDRTGALILHDCDANCGRDDFFNFHSWRDPARGNGRNGGRRRSEGETGAASATTPTL